MAIKLHFDNPNAPGVKLEIFRGTLPLDRANLPAPIATLTTHVTSWIDETAVKGTTYYYVFKTTGALDSKISRNVKVLAQDDKGVGDDKLYYGNLEYGYYGNIPASAFLTGQQLAGALGVIFPTYGNPTLYHKWSYKGKTVFVPNAFIGKGLSYNELAAAELVNGKIIQHGQFKYRVRMMKGYDPTKSFSDHLTAVGGTLNVETIPGFDSEWNRFVYPMCRLIPPTQIPHNVDAQTMALLGFAASVQFLMAEVNTDNTLVLCRGAEPEANASLTNATVVAPTTKNAFMTFLPVIELITDEV